MTRPTGGWTDQQVEVVVGNLLRIGVITAALVVLVGGIMYLIHYHDKTIKLKRFKGQPRDLCSPVGIVKDIVKGRKRADNELGIEEDPLEGRRRAVIQLGLLLLIATPVARVAFSVYAFARQRDFLYVGVTLTVLAILLYSLFSGYLQ
jgi:uncharacterized membrane protein